MPRWAGVSILGVGLLAGAAGARAEIMVGSWNIQTLATNGIVFKKDYRRNEDDFALLRAARDMLGADILVLEEVTSPYAVSKVFPAADYIICFSGQYDADAAGLSPSYPRDKIKDIKPTCFDDKTALPDPPTGQFRKQYVAIVVRRASGVAVESIADVPDLGIAFEEEDPETHKVEPRAVRWGLEAMVRKGTTHFRLLGVHLKSRCTLGGLKRMFWYDPAWTWTPDGDEDGHCMTLARQMAPLRAWIASAKAGGVPFMIAGDFNRSIDAETSDSRKPDLWPIITGDETAETGDDVALARAPEGPPSQVACWPEDEGTAFANSIDYMVFGPGFRPADWQSTYKKIRYADMIDPKTGKNLTQAQDGKRMSDHCPFAVLVK